MLTLDRAITRFGVTVHDHHDLNQLVPVHTGMQRQGDVLVQPRPDLLAATTAVPAQGVAVVRGENGGNTHLLLADGIVFFDQREASATSLLLGVLTVADGATAYLAHPEHAYSGIAPGTYRVLRQREQADELRLVAD